MAKYILGVMVIILAGIGGYYYFIERHAAPTTGTQQTTQMQPQATATTTYATSTFSVVYPVDFSADPTFENTEVSAKKPIAGVKFTIPGAMATGTNLGSDTFISVEQLPHAKKCTGDIYLLDNVTPTSVDDNGVTYSLATTSGAGAGNRYEEYVYAIASSSPCTAVRYWIHSSELGNYDPGMGIKAFDSQALMSAFDTIRRSVQLTQ